MEDGKKTLKKVGRILGGIICTIAGLAIAGFGVSTVMGHEKKYATLPHREDVDQAS